MEIRSTANPRVKQWAGLLQKKERERQARFVVEGVHMVQEALRSGRMPECIVYDREKGWPAELERPHGIETIAVTEKIMSKCTDAKTPQGIFAVLSMPDPVSVSDLMEKEGELVVLVDRIQDPGNLGTIIRSADAAGADGVLVGRGSADIYHPKTLRSTMGSVFHLPVAEADLHSLLPEIHSCGKQVVGAFPGAATLCYDIDWTRSSWILIGNEAHGISPELRPCLTEEVSIPMHGRAESLNAAMAANILLYEALRQRHYAGR